MSIIKFIILAIAFYCHILCNFDIFLNFQKDVHFEKNFCSWKCYNIFEDLLFLRNIPIFENKLISRVLIAHRISKFYPTNAILRFFSF